MIQLDIPGMEECLNIASSIEVNFYFSCFLHGFVQQHIIYAIKWSHVKPDVINTMLFICKALSTLDSLPLMYPFFYRPMFEVIEDGWKLFLPEDAFKDLESMVWRQLIFKSYYSSAMCPRCLPFQYCIHQTDEWRLSDVNKDFSVCPSYPSLVAVPKNIDDEALRKIATFRQGGRFPVLSYYHRKNGMVSTTKN